MSNKSIFRRIVDFFALRQSFTALLLMVILVGMGEKLSERFLPIYLLALGGGTLSIGLLNGMNNLLNALYSFPGGYLSDRLGYKKALLVFNLLALFGYAIVIIFPYWQAVVIGSIFFLSWTAISLPASMSMVSSVLPKTKRTMGVSMHSLVRRLPMALGPLLGGLFIKLYGETDGIRLAFVVAFILGVIAMIIQQIVIKEDQTTKKAEKNPFSLWKYFNKDLQNLLTSDILIRFCEQIPYAFAVVWVMKIHKISAVQFGILTTIEMVTAMLIYIPVAYYADKSTKKPFVAMTFVFFSLFPLILIFSSTFWGFVLAFVIRGLKEFGEPTRKALIMDLADEDKKAGTFGLYYLIRDVIVSIAAFGGAWLWQLSPQLNLIAAFVFGVLGTIYFIIFGKDLPQAAKND